MPHVISMTEYLQQETAVPLIDVRTPAEFDRGHIPGAFNIPLFSNEERVSVGTTYKQQSREQAILLGFDLVGHKWSGFIRQALEISPEQQVALHCWRGGMRSGAMAWAFELYGFKVQLIQGGYKSYRRWVREQFEKERKLSVLGGMTGSGKTDLLRKLSVQGQQVIDLEELAQHRGSAYGSLNSLVQPSQEQFENNLARALAGTTEELPLWLEDESLTIGKRFIPRTLWEQMQAAPLIHLEVPVEERVSRLVAEYGTLDHDFLIASTQRIRKRLGPEQTKHALNAIRENRMHDFIRLVLVYYDKSYRKGLAMRNGDMVCSTDEKNTEAIIQLYAELWTQQLQNP